MPKLMITCPETGKPADAGMSIDRQTFESMTLKDNKTPCPECKGSHTWDKEDAYFEGETPKNPPT